jgi:uncharacterized HAD superfamily protein
MKIKVQWIVPILTAMTLAQCTAGMGADGELSRAGEVSLALTQNAPDGQCSFALNSIPAFTNPPREKWRCSWWGCQTYYNLKYSHSAQHRVNDLIIKEGSTGTLTAKFSFGRFTFDDLENEMVYAYITGTGIPQWTRFASVIVNNKGEATINISRPRGQYRIRMVVAGNLTSAEATLTVTGTTQKAVVFDIDGTLTVSDLDSIGYTLEQWLSIDLGAGNAYFMGPELTKLYHDRGYLTVCLTGRPKELMTITRNWLAQKGAVCDHIKLTDSISQSVPGAPTEDYKTAQLNSLKTDKGLTFATAAYGNATTDIGAYNRAGISKAITYIIGSNAGKEGTQALYNSYAEHYVGVKNTLPQLCM